MRTIYKVKNAEYNYFITSTIVNWIPVFNIQQNVDVLIEALIFVLMPSQAELGKEDKQQKAKPKRKKKRQNLQR